ncbi:Ac92-like protein [Mauternbach virus]|uniref:Sulfhydryl oxidase n=1 Tax=Mauternbach virus TaxID=2486603 RepID=A0A3G3E889_9VIRU|nr:Ac92-like protein [Mauternbach virus]AYP97923.1 Ac92-like protein [Mauternbach virus]
MNEERLPVTQSFVPTGTLMSNSNIKSDTYLYENLPKDNKIDSACFDKPFDELFKKIAQEFKNLNIDVIIAEYENVLSEFYDLSRPFRKNSPKYNGYLENLIKTLCRVYSIRLEILHIDVHKYSTSEWGNVYWRFLHLTSILLNYAFERKYIEDFLDFPLIVYNIDYILPCQMCINHYKQIKQNDNVQAAIKSIAFGSAVIGMQTFHNLITINVDSTLEYSNRPKRPIFYIQNFASTYKCICMMEENVKKHSTYMKTKLDWQPNTHSIITSLLVTYLNSSYTRVSSLLKRIVYMNDSNFVDIEFGEQYLPSLIYRKEDVYFMDLTKKQVLYCLMNAILLQFQYTNITTDILQKNETFHKEILKFYEENSKIVLQLLEVNMPKHMSTPNREYILNKLNDIQTKLQKNSNTPQSLK